MPGLVRKEQKKKFDCWLLISFNGFISGILSLFCAQAGAAKVYAVEAADGLVNLIREVVAKNGFSHVIEVR